MNCSTPGLPVHHQLHPNSCPSSQWCHPATSSFVVPFLSCPQSFPASESFPMSQLFAWGGQSTGVSALASVLLKNTQDVISFRMDAVQGTLKSSPIPQFKSINSSALSFLHSPTFIAISEKLKKKKKFSSLPNRLVSLENILFKSYPFCFPISSWRAAVLKPLIDCWSTIIF